jgi:hypothetical protein
MLLLFTARWGRRSRLVLKLSFLSVKHALARQENSNSRDKHRGGCIIPSETVFRLHRQGVKVLRENSQVIIRELLDGNAQDDATGEQHLAIGHIDEEDT